MRFGGLPDLLGRRWAGRQDVEQERLGIFQSVTATRQIGTLESNLLIERSYARKLLLRHRLTYHHFQMIQSAIDHGYAVMGLL